LIDAGTRLLATLSRATIGVLLVVLGGPSLVGAADREPDAVRIVFAGDVMLGGGPGHAILHGVDPFEEFATLLRGADISVCNVECVLSKGGRQVLKPFALRGPEQSIPLLKRYFSAVSVANNHSGDFGKEAFQRQLTLMQKAELRYFGGGRNEQEARRPLILTRNGLRIALLGYNGFSRFFEAGKDEPGVAWLAEERVLEDIKAARDRQRADVVIPFLHWGEEEEPPAPTRSQRDFARRLIDAGASAVIGAHSHITQTVDLYRGRPIIYSLGNFVFDYYPDDPAVWTGWVVRLTLRKTGGIDTETFVLQIDKAGIPHLVPSSREMLDAEASPNERGGTSKPGEGSRQSIPRGNTPPSSP
jgi:poly-gamma-glutamate synthesis protein (capsule biosynthesis protein)